MAIDRDLLIRIGQATNIAVSLACAQKGKDVKPSDITPELVEEVFHTINTAGKILYLKRTAAPAVNIFEAIKTVVNADQLIAFRNTHLQTISALTGEDKIKFEEIVKKILTVKS